MSRLTVRLPTRAAHWSLLVFGLGTAVSAGLQRHLDPAQGTQRLVELDLGEAFASAAVIALVAARPRARPDLGRTNFAILVACALAWFLPEPHAIYLGMSLAGAWLVIGRRHDRVLRDVGQVWLALSFCELWSKLAFKMVYHVIEPFEVAAMSWVGRWIFPDLRSTGVYLSTRSDWSVVMLEGCSAFHNLSLAALVWLCILKIAGRPADRGALLALATSAGLVVAINIARILAMLPSPDAYRFWHDDSGSVLVALVSVAASMGPVILHVERTA